MVIVVVIFLFAIVFSSMGLGAIPSFPIALPGCSEECGNVSVPYPFGIGRPECAKNKSFFLNCAQNGTLFYTNVQVYNISLENSTYTAGFPPSYKCYNQTGFMFGSSDWWLRFRNSPFTISPNRNKLTALGCDTLGRMKGNHGKYFGSGCISLCDNTNSTALANLTSCSGFGCCQTPIPENIKELRVWVDSLNSHTYVWSFNPCSYAFVAENDFNISIFDLFAYQSETKVPTPPVVLEWVTGDDIDNCQASEGPSGYSCSPNANCSYSKPGRGSICSCLPGFIGNPYLQQGCKDIDECSSEYRLQYPCRDGTCKNINGSYICQCPLGMHGDGKVGCKGIRLTILIPVTILLGTISVSILYGYINILQYRRFIEDVNKAMVDLGFRKFEEAEIKKATNNYASDNLLGEGGFGSVYKGELEDDQLVAIKKSKGWKAKGEQDFINEMRIVSQVNHKNIVKILGLCLETNVRMLVYEFIPNKTLYFHITDEDSQILKSWKTRLRIASEIATALYYLHSSTHTPIVHGDIKSTNILLDDQNTAKVADFGASILTSQNQAEMDSTTIQGTLGYLDPEYEETRKLTEKSDVYSFGVVLIELLTGKTPSTSAKAGEPERDLVKNFISAVEDHRIIQVLDDKLKDDVEIEEVEAVAKLVKECLNRSGEKRPTMREVAEELERVKGYSKKTVPAPQETQETGGLAEVVELGKMGSYPSVHSSSFDTEQASTGSGTSPFPII